MKILFLFALGIISINTAYAYADNDGDGIADSLDLCPTRAEIVNDFEDSDGCPDVITNKPTTSEQGKSIPFFSNGMTKGAYFSINNVTIIEKEYYNVISFDVKISVNGSFEVNDSINVHPLDTFIQSTTDEVYTPDIDECKMSYSVDFSGKQGSNHKYRVCFSVEKEHSKFYVFYHIPIDDTYYHIGIIDDKSSAIQNAKIPNWVKNTMRWYIDGSISENEMISAIQFLVKSGVIKLN